MSVSKGCGVEGGPRHRGRRHLQPQVGRKGARVLSGLARELRVAEFYLARPEVAAKWLAGARSASSIEAVGHALWNSGDTTWCGVCGLYFSPRAGLL